MLVIYRILDIFERKLNYGQRCVVYENKNAREIRKLSLNEKGVIDVSKKE